MRLRPVPFALGPLALVGAGLVLILVGVGIWLWSRVGVAVWLDAAVAFCA